VKEHDIDDAFEWLIVVIGIITAVINQYPEYFYAVTPNPDRPFALRVAIGVVPIMLVITIIWLIGKVSSRGLVQALAKVIAWMLIIGTTWVNLIFYSMGIMIAFQIPRNEATNMNILGLLVFFLLCPFIAYRFIAPKYRDIYPDIIFLRKKSQLIFLIIATHVLQFVFMMATR